MDVTSPQSLSTVAAIGGACVGGVFLAFSGVVMPALARLSPSAAVAAMQAVNVTAVRVPLMLPLFGTAALCVATTWVALTHRGSPVWGWMLAGGLVYLVGVVGVTVVFNVPLNDQLAALAPDSAEAASVWRTYLSRWTAWNHVRTVAGLASAAAFLVGVRST